MRIAHFLFLLSFLSNTQVVQAQTDKSNYSLLWEITHNELEKPSYLFGTMHVRDQRAAEFPDSLLIVLENTAAYAMEIHPDTMVNFYMELFTQHAKENVLKDRLSEDAYERLNQAILKKTGKPIDSLENQDPSFVQYLLMDFDEPETTNKNNQIVDLYLYKQSWLMGKPIYGLEELKDYDNVTNQFFNMFEKDNYGDVNTEDIEKIKLQQYEEMIEIYQSGDLNALDKWLNKQSVDKDFNEAMLDVRNQKMVGNVEKMMKNQSTFFAVGTAHLSGEKGMLATLKNKGYNIRKVQATFTGYAQQFKPKGKGPKWNTTSSELFGYEIQTPGKTYDFNEVEMPGDIDFEVKFNLDMLDMNAFLAMNIGIPSSRKDVSLADLETILNNQSEGKTRQLLSKKSITHQGIKGGEFKYKEGGNSYAIWRIFVRQNAIQIFVVYREFNDFSSPNIQKFYDSLRFFEPTKTKTNFKKYESTHGGYTIEMPDNADYRRIVKNITTTNSRPSIIHQHLVTDKETGIYYLMQHHLMPVGNTVENEQLLLENTFQNMSTKWKQPEKKGQAIKQEGLDGLTGMFEVGKEKVILQEFIRGNRLYVMIIGGAKDIELTTAANQFFNSFKIAPYQHIDLEDYDLPKVEISMAFPKNAIVYETLEPDSEDEYPKIDEWTFEAMDSISGYNYVLNVYDFPLFYESTDKATFYDNYGENLKAAANVYSITDTTFNGDKAWYITYASKLHKGFTHSIVFFEGFRLYEASLYAPTGKDDVKAWTYFNSFKPTKDYVTGYLFSDRSELLLNNLQSRDTTIQFAAKDGIDRYELSPKNLPTIYQILEKNYPFDTLRGKTIHELMFQELLYTNDATTLPFLEKLYTKKAKEVNTQIAILETLAELKTKAAYDLYFELIANFEQKEFIGYNYNSMIAPLRDTLGMTANYYPQILEWRNNDALSYYSYNLVFNFLQNDVIDAKKIAKDRAKFLGDAKKIVDKYDLMNVEQVMPDITEFWHLDALHIILGELPAEVETQKYLSALLSLPSPDLVATLIDGLLLQNQPVPKSAFEIVLGTPYYWKELLSNLKFENNLDKIPADLLTQQNTAMAYVYNLLEGEYNNLTSFDFIDKRAYQGETEKVNLYLFTFTMEGYEKTYMGVVSQPLDETKIAVNPFYFDYANTAYKQEDKAAIYKEILDGWKQ